MNTQLDTFETALLTELRQHVAERSPAPNRRRRWALGGLTAALAGGLAVPLLLPTPAYTVQEGNAGEIIVQVNRPENAAGLEAQLAKHGITANVVYLPWSQECQTGRYTEVALGQTRGMAGEFGEDHVRIVLPPGAVHEGDTFVMSLTHRPIDNGTQWKVDFGIADGPVAPCNPR